MVLGKQFLYVGLKEKHGDANVIVMYVHVHVY